MRVFISWSGELSRSVGELIDEWLCCVLQAVKPWMSSKDIDRGSLWFNEISDQLADVNIGIICLTKENLNKPWILFEAGALAKGLNSNRVCPILIDLAPSDVAPPLSQFNLTKPTETDMYRLVATLNSRLGDSKLEASILDKVFEKYWPDFERRLEALKTSLPATPSTEVQVRESDDIMKEILSTVRTFDKRIRSVESKVGESKYVSSTGSYITVPQFGDQKFGLEDSPKSITLKGSNFKMPGSKSFNANSDGYRLINGELVYTIKTNDDDGE